MNVLYMSHLRSVIASLTALVCIGCSDARGAKSRVATAANSSRTDSVARARQDSVNRAQPGYVVDSVFAVEEELRRFRNAIGGSPVTELQSASDSRETLVRRFISDLNARDTVDLKAALVSPREFADFVYPSTPYTHSPYRQSPSFVWMQIRNPSMSGLVRVVRRRGGQRLEYVDHSCKPAPEIQGVNRLWLGCTVRVKAATGEISEQRLFGTIITRHGRFKFVSYANQF